MIAEMQIAVTAPDEPPAPRARNSGAARRAPRATARPAPPRPRRETDRASQRKLAAFCSIQRPHRGDRWLRRRFAACACMARNGAARSRTLRGSSSPRAAILSSVAFSSKRRMRRRPFDDLAIALKAVAVAGSADRRCVPIYVRRVRSVERDLRLRRCAALLQRRIVEERQSYRAAYLHRLSPLRRTTAPCVSMRRRPDRDQPGSPFAGLRAGWT